MGVVGGAFFISALPFLLSHQATRFIPFLVVQLSIAIGLITAAMTPVGIFDRTRNAYWRPPRRPGRVVALRDIHALQLLRQASGMFGFPAYELNVVLKSGNRVTCLVQRRADHLRRVSEELGTFLGVPVWDAVAE